MEETLYGIRFVAYVTAMALFGGSLIRVVMGGHAAGIDRVLRLILIAAAMLSFVAAVCWLMAETANMSGDLADAINLAALKLVLSQTQFGHLWIARLAIGVILLPLSIRGGWKSLTLAAALSLGALAGEGHAGIGAGMIGVLRIVNQALHLLAGGLWLGGLIPLVLALAPGRLAPEPLRESVRRFSGLGYGAVSVVLATGTVNAAIFLGAPDKLLDNPWGLTLLAKLGFVGITLGLAIVNRTVIVPGFAKDWPATRDRLRHMIYFEILAGLLVLSAVAVLGTLDPPVS